MSFKNSIILKSINHRCKQRVDFEDYKTPFVRMMICKIYQKPKDYCLKTERSRNVAIIYLFNPFASIILKNKVFCFYIFTIILYNNNVQCL